VGRGGGGPAGSAAGGRAPGRLAGAALFWVCFSPQTRDRLACPTLLVTPCAGNTSEWGSDCLPDPCGGAHRTDLDALVLGCFTILIRLCCRVLLYPFPWPFLQCSL